MRPAAVDAGAFLNGVWRIGQVNARAIIFKAEITGIRTLLTLAAAAVADQIYRCSAGNTVAIGIHTGDFVLQLYCAVLLQKELHGFIEPRVVGLNQRLEQGGLQLATGDLDGKHRIALLINTA